MSGAGGSRWALGVLLAGATCGAIGCAGAVTVDGARDAAVPDLAATDVADSPDRAVADSLGIDGGGRTEGGGGTDGPLQSMGVLQRVFESRTPLVGAVTANAGFATVYAVGVPVKAGDHLRVRGQVEMTNDYGAPVQGQIRLLVGGVPVGSTSGQNCVSGGAHHMPLWADSVTTGFSDGNVLVEAQYAAGRSDASPSVAVEGDYGHVVVEQYRRYSSRSAALADADARVMAEVALDRVENASSYGGTYAARAVTYNVPMTAGAGEVVRLLGQATGQYVGPSMEMHGQALFDGDSRLSPWATEDVPWATSQVPLFTDAVDERAAGWRDYRLSMHGTLGVGGGVVAGGGHLIAMRFAPVGGVSGAAREWIESFEVLGPTVSIPIAANSGWHTIHPVSFAGHSGDVVRLTSYLLLAYPADFTLGISCVSSIDLHDGAAVDGSSVSAKNVVRDVEVTPLRNELVTTLPRDGAYAAELKLSCAREAASPTVTVLGGFTTMLVDRYGVITLP
jgi:hypothetical protein